MISFVIPIYNESKRLYHNISEIISYIKDIDYEMILVDDGSKDNSWSIINKYQARIIE